MDVLNIQKDYGWVLKVLESCRTNEQIQTCEKVFKNFINKWVDELSEERLMTFNWNFQKHRSQKLINLRKSTL